MINETDMPTNVGSNAGLGRKCSRPKCDGAMLHGVAMGETFGGTPDFPGCEIVTLSACGPGYLLSCMKCNVCGHSVAAT
jgi:hypothetical protein